MNHKNILLIEDDEILSELIVSSLAQKGYNVDVAGDGKVGVEKLLNTTPDLILLDITMPEMNGYEFLEHTKENKGMPPIIVVSNSGQPVEITRVLELGVRDYVIKVNFRPSELIEKIEKVLAEPIMHDKENTKGDTTGCILLVEDDPFLKDLMSMQFAKNGLCVIHAMSGEEALDKLKSITPEIIILDILLPGKNGLEVLKEIKTAEKTKHIPVLVVSNFSNEGYIQQVNDLGADAYLIKAEVSTEKIYQKALSLMQE